MFGGMRRVVKCMADWTNSRSTIVCTLCLSHLQYKNTQQDAETSNSRRHCTKQDMVDAGYHVYLFSSRCRRMLLNVRLSVRVHFLLTFLVCSLTSFFNSSFHLSSNTSPVNLLLLSLHRNLISNFSFSSMATRTFANASA